MWALKWQVRTSPLTVPEIRNLKYRAEFREEFPLHQFCNWDFMCSAPCRWLLLQEQTWRAVTHHSPYIGLVAIREDVGFVVVEQGRTRDGNIQLDGSNLQICEVVKNCKPRFASRMRKKKVMSKNSLSFWLLAGWLNNACTSLHFQYNVKFMHPLLIQRFHLKQVHSN